MSVSFNKFYCFTQDIGRKVHNLNSDTLKMMLSNNAPNLTDLVKADIIEIAAGNGYTAGGVTITGNNYAQTTGTSKLLLDSFTITASGGSIGPWRYFILYNDTAGSKQLIGYADYGTSTTTLNGSSIDVNFDATNGVLQVG